MKLIELIKQYRGRCAQIPNCGRNDLPELFKDLGFKRGVEIGVYKAEYTEVLAKSGLEIYGVDPWKLYDDYDNSRGQRRLDDQYAHSQRVLAPYPNVKLIRKTSAEAVEDFEDESLDFVYIDGNHWFQYVSEDICKWTKKIKPGGIICGHDYIYTFSKSKAGSCHVHYVVDAYTAAMNIKDWWVLGRKDYVDGEIRDKWRSWMWFRPEPWTNDIRN
jgi:hypothetical protein